MMMKLGQLAFLLVPTLSLTTWAADWNQWRGADRDGVSTDSPPLISELPDDGLKPVWTSEDIPSARGGGWSSPVIVSGQVFIFAHERVPYGEDELPARKFPWLAPEKRVGMSDEEYAEYERKRRDEEEMRSNFYRFDETIYCVDAEDGKTLWKNERKSVYTRFPQSGSPAVVDGRLFVLGAARVARCIDATDGTDLWRTSLPGEFRDEMLQSSFLVVDNVAVVLADQLFGLHTDTGKILWQTNEDASGTTHTSPVMWDSEHGKRVLCNFPGGKTICIDPQNGNRLWSLQTFGGNATPVVDGDLLLTYGGSRKNGLRCFKLSDAGAEQLWTCQRTGDPGSSPVIVDDFVYAQGERRLVCVRLEDGQPMWMTYLDLNQPRYTSLVAADGKVMYAFEGLLCFSADSNEYKQLMNAKIDNDGLLADEEDFRKMLGMDELERTADGQIEADRLWSKRFGKRDPLPCSTPAIVDGRIYFRLKNAVACYDLRAR